MGRRAIRKLPEDLDLSRHLRRLSEWLPPREYVAAFDAFTPPLPLDPQALFARSQPLEIKMGSGKGLFLLTAAIAQPERNFLGIELAEKYAAFSAARLVRNNVDNARMISGDGLRFFRDLLPDACAAAVHVYFPDPWWKARHHKRRVMTPTFVKDIERVLSPGGTLHFWTDVEEYFKTSLEILAAATRLSGPLPVAEQSPQHDLDYRTNFERRKRQAGLPIYRAEFGKP